MPHSSRNGNGRGLRWALLTLVAAVFAVGLWAQSPASKERKRDTTPIRPTIPTANRNRTDRVFLERANVLKKEPGKEYQIVVGDVLFRRGGMYMYCDSAHFYDNPGAIEAYGNVRMEQGDTLFVYADELVYADTTQLAVLSASYGNKVRLINRDVQLSTDIFNYDLGIDLGYYEVGGVLTDPKNRLTSWYGEYSPASKDALFRQDVVLHSLRDKDTLDIYSEQMLYNTDTHIAVLDTTSTIISGDGTIYTTDGIYNTDTQEADLYRRSLVVANNGNTLTGDTLYYDRLKGFGEAFGNIEIVDTAKKVILSGDYGVYYEAADSARVYGRALAREYSQKDTLYLHGDTIMTFRRTVYPETEEDKLMKTLGIKAGRNPKATVDSIASDSIAVDSIAPDSIAADSLTVGAVATDSIAPDSIPPVPVVPADSLSGDTIPMIPLVPATPADSVAVDSVPGAPSMPVLNDSIAVPEAPAGSLAKMTAPADSTAPKPDVKLQPDTVHYLVAHPNVRFYRVDLQGICDSMTFVSKDSILHLDRHPVVWNEDKQIFGNQIHVHLNDSTVDWARLPEFGFVAEHIDEEFYNQLTGKEMYATFLNGQLHHLDVSGNVQAIMLPMENDSTYNKIANIESSFLSADFENQVIQRMKMWPETSGTMTPLYLAKKQIYYLPQFRWFEPLRPLSPMDVFIVPPEMRDLFQEPPFGTSRR